MIVCAQCEDEVGGGVSCRWQLFCAGVQEKLFWCEIYYANPRFNPGYHSGSRSHRGVRRRAPWVMWEYKLATAIAGIVLGIKYLAHCKVVQKWTLQHTLNHMDAVSNATQFIKHMGVVTHNMIWKLETGNFISEENRDIKRETGISVAH